MGGKVFPNLKRLNKQDFTDLVKVVKENLLHNLFTDATKTQIEPTRSYFTKETFGDMDLVVTSDYLVPDYLNVLKRTFKLADNEVSKNGNVVSFRLKDFQVDLLLTPATEWRPTYSYFSWNDLSNLMGRVTYKHGLKFGHRGVHVVVRDGTHEVGEILVTRSVMALCEYFSWDYYEWDAGFETMEDAYKWVVKTPFFNKEVFAYENRNHAATIRDRKRPNYANFLTWLETQENLPEYPYESTVSKGGYSVREPYFSMVCEKWPGVREQYESMMARYQEHKLFASKWNGDLVSKHTGLVQKELGELMKFARKTFEQNPHLRGWVLSDNFEDIHCNRFANSLKWHMENNQVYGAATLMLRPMSGCDNCEKSAVMRYFGFNLCEDCAHTEKELNNHKAIAEASV